MSEFFRDFLKKARTVSESAGRRTDELYRLSRLKLRSVLIRNDIKNRYEELGMRVYEMYHSGEENTNELLSRTGEIDGLLRRLEETERKIAELSHYSVCPGCGEKNSLNSVYCSQCGKKLTATEEAVEENENRMDIAQA